MVRLLILNLYRPNGLCRQVLFPCLRYKIMNKSVVQNQINYKTPGSAIHLENLIHPNDKLCKLKKRINWDYLDAKLGHLFEGDQAPPPRLIFGLLYLQSIDNLPCSDIIAIWEKSPEWQYFCGEEVFKDKFPLHSASLSIWSRVVGTQGRVSMTRALGAVTRNKVTLH